MSEPRYIVSEATEYTCSCDRWPDYDDDLTGEEFARHQAEAVRAALLGGTDGWVRRYQAGETDE